MPRFLSIAVLGGVMMAAFASAEIVSKQVEYKHGDTTLEGYLVYDDKIAEPRPGVMLIHEWWGLTDHIKNLTRQVAEMGYVAFAADMYGKGVSTDSVDRAREFSGQFGGKDDLRRARLKAGFDVFAAQSMVDKTRIAAIGFCFGGTCVLHMAYSGLDLKGVVSLHGSLVAPSEGDQARIKARILVLHGADDPLVPAEAIAAFQDGVRKAKADWQMIYYGGAAHSFTNPGADKVGFDGVRYDAKADARSRRHMKALFDEIFAK